MRSLPGVRRGAGVLLLVLAALIGPLLSVERPAPAPAAAAPQLRLAADATQFRPGNIISDVEFFDGNAMSATGVQSFLDSKGRNCVAGAMPCLKDYRQNTPDRAADAYCQAYAGAPGESAATIIHKVGRACGISQRVLLVLLQKEQSLVAGTRPSTTQYQKATGYACPDTAPCDTRYYGFFNQVYSAASRFKYYAATSTRWNYQPGRLNYIQYNPNASCGGSKVFIQNQATANLYVYTPYQPNQAALAAGYGSAPCGAYGNRNFWLYYTDWFGGPGAIDSRAKAPGANLGSPTSGYVCGLLDGGCFRAFEQGSIYWSPGTGPQIVKGEIGKRWGATGWEYGRLGYPTGEELCGLKYGGCFQVFQKGRIYWSMPTGAHTVMGEFWKRWDAQKWETGPLGYPTRDEDCGLTGGGCFQTYEGGSIYWTRATGARIVSGAVYDKWKAQKWELGPLGYPTGELRCGLRDGGCTQAFQGGAVYTTPANGVRTVPGTVFARWKTFGYENGVYGYPTQDATCRLADGGCYQAFQGGRFYWSNGTGGRGILPGPIYDRWQKAGAESGALGYPTGDTTCGLARGGCGQLFQNGAVYTSPATGTRIIRSEVLQRWRAGGAERGALGYPTTEQDCTLLRGGCFQVFEGGLVYRTPGTGTHAVAGAVFDEWTAHRWETGLLGYPSSEQRCGLADDGCVQEFEGGLIYTSASTGTHTVLGAIGGAFVAQGRDRGPLGYPTGNEQCGQRFGGCVQTFQHGSVYWTPGTGAHPVYGAVGAYWTAAGAASGGLGLPITDAWCGLVRRGCYQVFQKGSVYWTATTGAHTVSGAIRTYWGGTGWELGPLGYPTADAVSSGNQRTQRFEGGTLVQNRSTGQVTRR